MIELAPPAVFRESRPERFTVAGFTCPVCHGNGWGWRDDVNEPLASPDGWMKVECPACGGTGEVYAEVTVNWKRQEGGVVSWEG